MHTNHMVQHIDIVDAIAQILMRRPKNSEYLSRVGNILRKINKCPTCGLQKFVLSNEQYFSLTKGSDETCIVQLICPQDFEIDPKFPFYDSDYESLERDIVLFMLEHMSKGKSVDPISLPALGEYCKLTRGINMKGKLVNFLSDRSHLFILPDTGRQHVLLNPGACEALGIQESQNPIFPETISEFWGPDTSSHIRSLRMDKIATELYMILFKAGGILPIRDIEQEMRTTRAAVINATGIDEGSWHIGSTIYKYPHVFHRLNQSIALVDHIKPPSVGRPDAFPPLSYA